MKKILSLILALTVVFCTLPFGTLTASAETEYTSGYYTYTVSNGEVTITDCDTSIRGAVTIPSTLGGCPITIIGEYAFLDCRSLTSIIIPDSVISIGKSAFSNCSQLTKITIPDSVTSIGNSAFADCMSLKSVTIPDNVTSIGNSAFYFCVSLKSVTIPDSVTSIGDHAFSDCGSLTSITIPDSVTSIGDYAFNCCHSLTSITVPDSVTIIGNSAFCGCSLTSITIPNGVTSIDDFTFYCCSELISITIPDSVTSIGLDAFEYCSSLKTIYYEGTAEKWANININSGNDYLLNSNIIYSCEFIALLKLPEKLRYNYGDALDLTGGKIVVGYRDGTFEFKDITADMISGFDNTSGLKILIVSYCGKETEFPILCFRNPDLDGNGTTSATDVAILKKSLLTSDNQSEDFDLNVDGSLDILDLVYIKKAAS